MQGQESSAQRQRRQPGGLVWLLLALAVLTLYRAGVARHALPLYLDEAQYWVWSLTPDWGYYSKPPMVAWLIRLFSVFGDGELSVRMASLLLYPLSALLVHALGRRMFDARTATGAALLFISLPLVGFNSLFMTTDAPLMFFWGVASYALWNGLQRNRRTDWLLLGVAVGLGLLSKYSMALFAISVGLLLCLPHYRRHWRQRGLLGAAALALLIFLPNLWWNARTGFVSFRHTAEISQLGGALFHPARLAEFIGAQFACMGPIGFAFLLAALAAPAVWHDPKQGFLAALTLPFLGVIALQALLAKANANWAAPAYFAGSLLVAARLLAQGRLRWAVAAFVLNLALLSAFYHYRSLAGALGITLTRASDPYARVLGWPRAGQEVGRVLARYPHAHLATVERAEFALLHYYVRPHPVGMCIWNPAGERRNQFHLTADIAQARGASFIIATSHPMDAGAARAFEQWSALGQLSVPLYPDDALRLYLYRGERFRGYPP